MMLVANIKVLIFQRIFLLGGVIVLNQEANTANKGGEFRCLANHAKVSLVIRNL